MDNAKQLLGINDYSNYERADNKWAILILSFCG